MRTLLIITTFFLSNTVFACMCGPMTNSKEVKESFEWAELIVEGTFLSNLTNRSSHEGLHILFKVNSVLKGELTIDTISIFQLNTGNCRQRFEKDKKYLIYGNQISKIECIYSSNQSKDSELPPPPKNFENGILKETDCTSEHRIDYWNKLIAERPAYLTNQCLVFITNSKAGQLILSNLCD
jgi:hypothetical protein